MSRFSAGIVLCEPTELYNILTQGDKEPAFLYETYLAIFDARDVSEYYSDHVILARSARSKSSNQEQDAFHIPSDLHLPTIENCVVYDNNTVSKIENTPAVQFANIVASRGSKNPVMILKGGYERFSAEYPFLRTEKIMFTPRELQHLPHYPNEVLPLFLYIGEEQHANNAALNYDLKIHTHLVLGEEVTPAFPGKIQSLHLKIKDEPKENEFNFPEICMFLETCWKKSERVLVFEESGCSRTATAVMAYLIKKNKLTLKEAYAHVKRCKRNALPLQAFLDQLTVWEGQI